METYKKRRGDRKDGRLLRELDSLHFITGIIYPNRCDNEAYISVKVDLTAMNAYLAKRTRRRRTSPTPCSIWWWRRWKRPSPCAPS